MGLNSHFTPYARESSWGKLLDQKAAILLIGVDLRRFTYIHGVEEWLDIPGRLTHDHEMLYTILPKKRKYPYRKEDILFIPLRSTIELKIFF
ncbi:hypothetical protein E2R56_26145 [Rhodococcus qingshengii]|nr:hypothetical protein E2R56_26145 [Rhodococcus qingshengii]